jgi:hypothetical protein
MTMEPKDWSQANSSQVDLNLNNYDTHQSYTEIPTDLTGDEI